MEESKSARFVRIAEPRIDRACKSIRLLGNLSASGYAYTDEQVDAMFAAVQAELDTARTRFRRETKKFRF